MKRNFWILPARGTIAIGVILGLLGIRAEADVGTKVQDWFDAQNYANVTAPGVYEGQTASYFTAGSANWRSHQQAFKLYSFQTPNLSAGCGGIDLYTGGFSAINADQFVESLRAIGENGLGLLFMLGIDMVSPKLGGLIAEMKAFANKYQQFAGDSCAIAQELVGGGLEKLGMAEGDCVVRRMNNNSEDYLTAKERCTTGGQAANTINSGADAGEVGFVEGNLMWYFLMEKDPFFKTDLDLAELIMNFAGTLIHVRPDPGSSDISFAVLNIPSVQVGPQGQLTGRAKALYSVLMKGENAPNDFRMFRCAEDRSANPKGCWKLSDSPVAYDNSFPGLETRVRNELAGIVNAIRNNQPLSETAKGIIRSTSYPIYRYLRSITAYMPRSYSAEMMVNDLAEPLADELISERLVELLEQALLTVSTSKYGIEEGKELAENLDKLISGLQARQMTAEKRLNRYFEMIQRAQLFDKAMMGRLAAGLYAASNANF